ncbi:hypothetical protein C0J52_25210 [Blattella germanica]|nr:hypothetical protein C0J52_25210 [Blattella germanica]
MCLSDEANFYDIDPGFFVWIESTVLLERNVSFKSENVNSNQSGNKLNTTDLQFELRSNVHSYSTRNAHQLQFPYIRLSKSQSYYKYLGYKLYSKPSYSIKNLDIRLFKSEVYNWFLKNPFYCIQEYLDMTMGFFLIYCSDDAYCCKILNGK